MISLHVNGESFSFENSLTVLELIQRIQVPSSAVAVAVNSEIVPRSSFETVRLCDQDQVEIIRPVGGG